MRTEQIDLNQLPRDQRVAIKRILENPRTELLSLWIPTRTKNAWKKKAHAKDFKTTTEWAESVLDTASSLVFTAKELEKAREHAMLQASEATKYNKENKIPKSQMQMRFPEKNKASYAEMAESLGIRLNQWIEMTLNKAL